MDEVDSKEKIDRWCRVPEPMVNLREGVSWRRSPRFLIRADEELIMYVQRSSPPWTRSILQYLIIALLVLSWLLLGFVNFVTNISETSEEKYAIGKYVNTSPAAHNSFYIDPYICVILTKILNAFSTNKKHSNTKWYQRYASKAPCTSWQNFSFRPVLT